MFTDFKPLCRREGCDRPARAHGLCDTDYRRERRDALGKVTENGRPSIDRMVFKIRVVSAHGSQPYYYSDPVLAYRRARQEKEKGNLVFFARYSLEERLI